MDETNKTASEPESKLSIVMSYVIPIALAIVVALIMRAFVIEPFVVPSGSMLETIKIDNMIWSEKVSYRFHAPAAGDVITFANPADESVTLIKRVIATAGQTIDLQDGKVVVDGTSLNEPYTLDKPSYPLDTQLGSIGQITYPYTVPEGHVWVMGDNRTNSKDSRYFGAVPLTSVSGHALFVLWPLSDAHWL